MSQLCCGLYEPPIIIHNRMSCMLILMTQKSSKIPSLSLKYFTMCVVNLYRYYHPCVFFCMRQRHTYILFKYQRSYRVLTFVTPMLFCLSISVFFLYFDWNFCFGFIYSTIIVIQGVSNFIWLKNFIKFIGEKD